jgi:hypothetical protein
LIETEQQRRWWFATHPEYSGHRAGRSRNRGGFKTTSEKSMTKNQVWIGGEEGYNKGFDEGYWAIRRRQVPPNLDPADESAYAHGVRHGAEKALDENERWAQQWLDPLSMLLGTHPSYKLNKELTKRYGPKPQDHEGHHIVAWRHWRAGPARQVLERYGIDLYGADNGMWLHRTSHYPLANSYRYYDRVNRMLGRARSKKEALSILEKMKDRLAAGKFP